MRTAKPDLDRAIIISNGRSGSTLLSDLLAKDEETLSVSEFFAGNPLNDRFDDVISGKEYWTQLSSRSLITSTMVRAGTVPPEVARYAVPQQWRDDPGGLPFILTVVLPSISPDPTALFEELAVQVPGFPEQPVRRHHVMLLDLLATRLGRRRWVERSGASSLLAAKLLRAFPMAKVVYLTRERTTNARSMSRHSSFQLLDARVMLDAFLGYDPYTNPHSEHPPLPPELDRYMPHRLTAEALAERGADQKRFLMLSNFMSAGAEQAIEENQPRELLSMRYEELVSDPLGQLNRVGQFLGLADWADWSERCAPYVRNPSSAERH